MASMEKDTAQQEKVRVFAVCAICNRVRMKNKLWKNVPQHILSDEGTILSHGLCPDCLKEHYADVQ